MAICPEYWQRARQEAPIHLQIRLETRPDLRQLRRLAGGPIVRIFRDETGQLKLGRRISFFVPLDDGTDGGAHPDPMPGSSGQDFGVDVAAMKAARFLEVYLAPHDDGFEVVRDQVTVLRRSTRQPVNPPDSEGYGILLPQGFWKSRRRSILARWTALAGLPILAAFLLFTQKEVNRAGWRNAAVTLEPVGGKTMTARAGASNEAIPDAQKRVDSLLHLPFADELADGGFSSPRVELAAVRDQDRAVFAEIRVNVTHATGPHWFWYQVFLSADDASRRFDSIVNPFRHASAPGTTNEWYSVEYKRFEPVMVIQCADSSLDTDRSNRHTIQCWLRSGKEVVSAGTRLVHPTESELSDGRRRVADLVIDALLSSF